MGSGSMVTRTEKEQRAYEEGVDYGLAFARDIAEKVERKTEGLVRAADVADLLQAELDKRAAPTSKPE